MQIFISLVLRLHDHYFALSFRFFIECFDATRVALSVTPARAGIKCSVQSKRKHSQECKQPLFLGTNTQSQLTVQEITPLEGNKNKTGSLEGLQLSTKKEDFKNNVSLTVPQTITSQEHQAETVLFQHSARQTPSETITKNQHSKECNSSSQFPGPRLQSSLTCQEDFFPQGNKNKNGFFCGSNDGTRIQNNIDKALKKEHSDSTEGISMVNSNESVNENYSLHNSFLLDHASAYASTYNCEPQQFPGAFGFIPEGPLKLYVGKPIHWEHIPNVIRSHLLIKASGPP